MKVEFVIENGELFVEVYQQVWDEIVLVHRDKVDNKVVDAVKDLPQ
ncbi:hypothetical protein NXG04_07355 [Klebsiella pneumoniae]|nr:hypothetical protein [Klebsiella pneumoniae]MDS7714369.1 hypothetical protein [Klebsiella pneumoniae]